MKHPLFLLLLCAAIVAAHAQSTAFTYQGRLAANGLAYNGPAEVQFTLFSTPMGGSPLASNGPAVVNVRAGLFTIALDFGAPVFDGADRWLEIQVRTNIGAFFTLIPRQPVTPTPYALYARTAGTAGPWGINGSNVVYNGGKVGIGTTNPGSVIPSAKLEVVGGDVVVSHNSGFMSLNAAGTGISAGIKSGLFDDLRLIVGGAPRVKVSSSGRVSIGAFGELSGAIAGVHINNETTQFAGTLALEGDTHTFMSLYHHGTANGRKGLFGFASAESLDLTIANEAGGRIVLHDSGGTHLPTCGEESLRIVRGTVILNGPDLGSGFTVIELQPGEYVITFETPFPATPTVTATARVASSKIGYASIEEIDSTHVRIASFDSEDDTITPHSFDFIAIGSR